MAQAPQDFRFELEAHAQQLLQLVVDAQLLQFFESRNAEMVPQGANRLRAQTRDFQHLQRGWRVALEKLVAPFEAAALADLCEHRGQPLADAGNFGQLAGRIFTDILDPFRITFYDARAVAVAADAKAVLFRDFHQIGGLAQQACNLDVLHGICPPGVILAARAAGTTPDSSGAGCADGAPRGPERRPPMAGPPSPCSAPVRQWREKRGPSDRDRPPGAGPRGTAVPSCGRSTSPPRAHRRRSRPRPDR